MAEDDEKLKSALEIALEKAEKLGSMSPDEKQKLKAEKLESVGLALSKRYLQGLPIRDVEMELAKYKEERKTVVRYLLSSLLAELDLSDPEGAERLCEAVKHFSGTAASDKVSGLLSEYRNAMEQAWQKSQRTIRAAKLKELKQRGISGSAVEPAIESSTEWLQQKANLNSEYKKRLERTIYLPRRPDEQN